MRLYNVLDLNTIFEKCMDNIALISYYFGGKEKLYSHILSTQFEQVESAFKDIAEMNLKPKDKIVYFFKQIVMLHGNYPYLLRLSLGEIINPTNCFDHIVKNGITMLNQFLICIIKEGIEAEDFRSDIDPAVVALSFIGSLNFYVLALPLSEEFIPQKDSQFEYFLEQTFQNYLLGIQNR